MSCLWGKSLPINPVQKGFLSVDYSQSQRANDSSSLFSKSLIDIGHTYGIYEDSPILFFQTLKGLASQSVMPMAFLLEVQFDLLAQLGESLPCLTSVL